MHGKKDWLPQDCIDLHGFTRAEAFAVTRRFLDQAQQRGSLTSVREILMNRLQTAFCSQAPLPIRNGH